DRADRHRADVLEDRLPDDAAVGRPPDAAGGGGDIDNVRILLDHGEVVDAAADDRRTELAPFQACERVVGAWSGRVLRAERNRQQGDECDRSERLWPSERVFHRDAPDVQYCGPSEQAVAAAARARSDWPAAASASERLRKA